jgi:hypothetical protein
VATDLMKTTNKLIIGLLVIGLAGLFTITTIKATAENPVQSAGTVILGYTTTYHYAEGRYIEDGLEVRWVSRSASAPEIPIGSNLAEAMAYLQDNGYELAVPATARPEYVFIRRRR